MDVGLHQKQGVSHLVRVLNYYPFIAEDGKATVHLTFEDWHVVADTLFHMDTPRELLPDAIRDYQLANQDTVIEISTDDCVINVEMI